LILNHRLFFAAPTASVVLSMPLLVASGFIGVIAAFKRQRPIDRALRILLITSALTASVVMVFGWILERFEADFMPLLILASMIGVIEVWRALDGGSPFARRCALVVVCSLTLFGLWTNVGLSVTPTAYWSRTQLAHYIHVQRILSNITGHPIDHYVESGSRFPAQAPMGTLLVMGRCQDLFVADQSVPPTLYYPLAYWSLVERAPHAPLCHSLMRQSGVRLSSLTLSCSSRRLKPVGVRGGRKFEFVFRSQSSAQEFDLKTARPFFTSTRWCCES
jgi:hypothetical protein